MSHLDLSQLRGPPAAICRLNIGITLPDDPSTFPNRTVMNLVRLLGNAFSNCNCISARRLDAPITLVGFIALSVEIRTKVSVLYSEAIWPNRLVPNVLFLTASDG